MITINFIQRQKLYTVLTQFVPVARDNVVYCAYMATGTNWKFEYERLFRNYRKEVIGHSESTKRWTKQLRDNLITIQQLENELEDAREREKAYLRALTEGVNNS